MPIAFVYCLLPFAYCLLLCLFIALVSLEAPRSGKELAEAEDAILLARYRTLPRFPLGHVSRSLPVQDLTDDSEDKGHEDGGDSECQDEPDAPVTISQSPAHEGEGGSIRLLPLAPPIAYCLLSIVFCLLHAPWYRTMGMKKESTPSVRMSRMHW